jgi:hypothetical protein
MTTLALTYTRMQKKVLKSIDAVELPIVNWKIACLLCSVACLGLLIFYVYQINELTKGSYLINSYSKQVSQLSKENKNLQISFAENSFLGDALLKIQSMSFQKVSSVKYIQISENALAKAK